MSPRRPEWHGHVPCVKGSTTADSDRQMTDAHAGTSGSTALEMQRLISAGARRRSGIRFGGPAQPHRRFRPRLRTGDSVRSDRTSQRRTLDGPVFFSYVRLVLSPGGTVSARSNEDIIRIVTKYQNFGMVHELTCASDGRHEALEPVERDGKIVLVCPTCDAVQEEIPAFVLGSEEMIDFSARKWAEAEARARRTLAPQDIWFAVAVILCCFTVLPGVVGGALYAAVGACAGAILAFVHARRSFRKLDRDAAPPDTRP